MPRLKQGDGYRSKVAHAHSNSPSLRTTIPQEIVHALGLREGDELEWRARGDQATVLKVRV